MSHHHKFDGILNFRDVGQTINALSGSHLLLQGRLFRSARLDDASSHDRRSLLEDYEICTVIDLRTKSEHIKQSRKRQQAEKSHSVIPSNDNAADPWKITGIHYYGINFNGGDFERALFSKLSPWSQTKLLGLMLFGYRMEAIGIMGREVLEPRGLIGLGYDSIDLCGKEICQSLKILSDPRNYPVVIHCTQGKDRTGIVVALVLFLLKIPLEDVSYDYTLSETELLPNRDERLGEIREVGLSEEFATAPADWIQKIWFHLNTKYGGIIEYLLHIGVDEATQDGIRNSLLANDSDGNVSDADSVNT